MTRDNSLKVKTFYSAEKESWRNWLAENFEKEKEIWFVFPMKASDEKGLSYNDAVEQALCFGWIDSTIRNIDHLHRAQRFTPRKNGSGYSRPNIERLIYLEKHNLLHPCVKTAVAEIIRAPYVFPPDILAAIHSDSAAWENYLKMPEGYKRIRTAYIDAARKRPAEFEKRLKSFIASIRRNTLIGYGGIEKYYTND